MDATEITLKDIDEKEKKITVEKFLTDFKKAPIEKDEDMLITPRIDNSAQELITKTNSEQIMKFDLKWVHMAYGSI